MIAAGKLDRRITIQAEAESRDASSGEVSQAWATYAQVWASREPLRATERFQAEQFAAKTDTRFVIRHLPELDPKKHRILADDGKVYEITGVLERGRREEMEILAWARAEAA